MEILLICTAILYVLWLISFAVLGDYKVALPFTVVFVLAPIAFVVIAFLAPLAVIFSKTAREETRKKMNGE
jgi:hypothetical protein